MSQGFCGITLRALVDRAAVIVLVCFDESLEAKSQFAIEGVTKHGFAGNILNLVIVFRIHLKGWPNGRFGNARRGA